MARLRALARHACQPPRLAPPWPQSDDEAVGKKKGRHAAAPEVSWLLRTSYLTSGGGPSNGRKAEPGNRVAAAAAEEAGLDDDDARIAAIEVRLLWRGTGLGSPGKGWFAVRGGGWGVGSRGGLGAHRRLARRRPPTVPHTL